MKTYKWIDLGETVILKSTDESGKNWQIPTDPANSHYAEYLRYTEWVEAGNNPEDFWTRDLDSPEGLEQTQVTEEKEETPQETEGES